MKCVICSKEYGCDKVNGFVFLTRVCSPKCLKVYLDIGFYKKDIFEYAKENPDIRIFNNRPAKMSAFDIKVGNELERVGINYSYQPYIIKSRHFIRYSGQPVETRKFIPNFYLKDYGIFFHVITKNLLMHEQKFYKTVCTIIPIIISHGKMFVKGGK